MKCPHCKKSSMGIVGNDDSIFECRYLDCHAEYSINYVQGFWDGYNEASQQAVEAKNNIPGKYLNKHGHPLARTMFDK